ncbi:MULTISPECIES: carboxy terminal-processing peptidase [Proteus]|uniref:Carboxy terminal-processing peptidase n=1 Tax=Proteus penneri TaxID=102862 RepID=A0ABS0VYX1_9GAMM|nr:MULTISPECIES: carboxy terminal-processing peptidase [Proteus]MBJ2116238.1 carboxy terminal-processing peptidase [Proteus penneri]NBM02117.1 carboxy terminal-processing peptidase [Proteus sp. G2671]NBM13373.1 carboxy terminal-processing peptidase [Proteus sp. G2670]NBM32910.1 carboxy terminal-processing peptidase [Proteus sp. G2664]NBM69334.1 carboxy terminal-processing peptidase [Proteus sp. G2663]
MNKLLNVAFAIGLTLIGTSVVMAEKPATPAMVTIDQLPELKQEPQHSTVSERVTSRFERSHYRQFSLDANFSEKIFNRYLNLLDYSHNVLLASDIAQFDKEKTKVGEYLKKGELQPLYDLFNLAQKRRFERFQYALNRLDKPMDLTGQDKFELDRTKAPWPQTQAELDKLWDEKVKYDWLTLKLSDKTDSEIKETLTKRYKAALRRQTQSQSEDVFQIIMSAFAREIDPHTSYLSPRNTEAFDSEMSLSLEGIGAVLQMDDDYPMINSMVTGGPAAKSKELKVGDKIIAVGQQNKPMVDVVGWRLDDIVALIKGPKGSQVKLEVISDEKGAKPRTITLVREQIRLEDRAVKLTEKVINGDKVAILDIPSFYVGLTNDVKTQLQRVAKDNVSSLVIDLRGNGGGALTEAISLSGLFIPSGPVVQVRDNNGRVRQDFDKDDVVYYKGPLVVIVNRFSASASEIFAAAMQDYGRALIVGEQTFGKGTVQQYRPLTRVYDQMLSPDWPGLGSVQYTIQKFYRINGGSTQLKGVTPDLLLPSFDSAEMGESFEDNALPWDSISPASYQLSEYSDKLKAALVPLTEQHTKRIANDREFSYIFADIQRYNDAKAKGEDKFVVLNFAEREKENKELETIKLNRINERFKLEGKPALKSLDDLPKDYEGPDPYLDETAKIAVDLSKVLKPKKLLN